MIVAQALLAVAEDPPPLEEAPAERGAPPNIATIPRLGRFQLSGSEARVLEGIVKEEEESEVSGIVEEDLDVATPYKSDYHLRQRGFRQ